MAKVQVSEQAQRTSSRAYSVPRKSGSKASLTYLITFRALFFVSFGNMGKEIASEKYLSDSGKALALNSKRA